MRGSRKLSCQITDSQKLGFRCTEFSETQFVPLLILGTPIYRGNSMRSGLGLYANAPTTFRCMEFSETRRQPVRCLCVRTGAKRYSPDGHSPWEAFLHWVKNIRSNPPHK